MLHSGDMSPQLPWAVTVSQTLPVFDDLGSLEAYWAGILSDGAQLGFPDGFLTVRLGYGFGMTEGKGPSQPLRPRPLPSTALNAGSVDLHHLGEVGL